MNGSGLPTVRRLQDAGLPEIIVLHSFRVMVMAETCWARTCRWRMCSTWPGTPTPRARRSTTAEDGE